jgi:hypothetical protein
LGIVHDFLPHGARPEREAPAVSRRENFASGVSRVKARNYKVQFSLHLLKVREPLFNVDPVLFRRVSGAFFEEFGVDRNIRPQINRLARFQHDRMIEMNRFLVVVHAVVGDGAFRT